jgi:hypothetical protein
VPSPGAADAGVEVDVIEPVTPQFGPGGGLPQNGNTF